MNMVKVHSTISLNKLKAILQQEVKEVSLEDLYKLSLHFNSETKYLPEKYKKEYTESVQNVIISRLKSLKNDRDDYEGNISEYDLPIINELLKKEDEIENMLNITVIYATYFLKEPIHNISTAFPGTKNVYKKGKDYYCPVKKYHINDNKSLCKYCVAKIDED